MNNSPSAGNDTKIVHPRVRNRHGSVNRTKLIHRFVIGAASAPVTSVQRGRSISRGRGGVNQAMNINRKKDGKFKLSPAARDRGTSRGRGRPRVNSGATVRNNANKTKTIQKSRIKRPAIGVKQNGRKR